MAGGRGADRTEAGWPDRTEDRTERLAGQSWPKLAEGKPGAAWGSLGQPVAWPGAAWGMAWGMAWGSLGQLGAAWAVWGSWGSLGQLKAAWAAWGSLGHGLGPGAERREEAAWGIAWEEAPVSQPPAQASARP